MTPHELKEMWLNRALARAGIDRSRWGPSRGVEENRRTIEAVYSYYGQLFDDHPYLEWAGLASTIGPAFYAGFMDIGWVPDAIRRTAREMLGRISNRLAAHLGGDLGFYETTFLTMQKQIFEDQATMHEAYLGGGLEEIERLCDARIIDEVTRDAWREIDSGRDGQHAAAVAQGNRTLLFREQHDIIDRFYIRMLRHRPPLGTIFTYVLTLAGAPSVPGAHSYAECYPLILVVRLPRRALSLTTPLANGNIAIFANRWKLIDDDTLPEYLTFLRDAPGAARAMATKPVVERAGRYRLLARAGQLIMGAVTGWGLEIRPVRDVPRFGVMETIDLTTAPTRAAAGFSDSSDSRIWMNARRAPLLATVALPEGRAFQAQVELAIMLSAVRGGPPDRLTLQLPPGRLDRTAGVLIEYARVWGFPVTAVDDWRTGSERRAATDRTYSTHVFGPSATGFVRLEFQVSHHVHEGEFVIAALFSWAPSALES